MPRVGDGGPPPGGAPHEGDQAVERRGVSLAPGQEQFRDVVHAAGHWLMRGNRAGLRFSSYRPTRPKEPRSEIFGFHARVACVVGAMALLFHVAPVMAAGDDDPIGPSKRLSRSGSPRPR